MEALLEGIMLSPPQPPHPPIPVGLRHASGPEARKQDYDTGGVSTRGLIRYGGMTVCSLEVFLTGERGLLKGWNGGY